MNIPQIEAYDHLNTKILIFISYVLYFHFFFPILTLRLQESVERPTNWRLKKQEKEIKKRIEA